MAQALVRREGAINRTFFQTKTYAQLRELVKETLLLGQQRIERERAHTYWETGRIIDQHIRVVRPGKKKADYSEQVMSRLSRDLGISETVLYRCLRFAQCIPNLATWPNLLWSHYRTLMTIPDEKKRCELADRANRLKWNARELEAKVKRISKIRSFGKDGKENPPLLTSPKVGSFYTYRIIDPKTVHSKHTNLLVDLGFVTYLEAERFEILPGVKLEAGDLVRAVKDRTGIYTLRPFPPTAERTEESQRRSGVGALRKAIGRDPEFLFTYQAYVERIIDGDTLKVQIDLGFGILTRQILRLRGINAPEIDTQGGKAAKEFMIRELEKEPYVIIKSTRSDKYDRYLADIFYKKNLYLNQRLLDEGYAELI